MIGRMLLWLSVAVTVSAADDLTVLRKGQTPPPAQMVRAYLTGIANAQLAARRREIAQIRTPEDFERRRLSVRAKLVQMIGGLPDERTPLNVQKTGEFRRDGYRVEKLVYESLPKFYVTANLYVPTTGGGPYPAVLQPIGHSKSAKNRAFYQTLAIGLVKQGFVVLNYDPIGQGERRIFWDSSLGDSKVGSSTTVEHEMVGMQNVLGGESVARYRIWDGIRGIDLLASRPEVDEKRIGVSGCSGGGTLTVYIAALDPRVAVAAPACYVTSWEEQLKGTGPQDAEQQFPDLLKEGMDHADLVTLMAPKPYLICSTTEDFFPIEGARRTFDEAKRIYTLFGAADRVAWFFTGGGHGMPQPTREAIYGWMKRWLASGPQGPAKEPPIETEFEETMNATPTGQVATSLGGETASTLNRKRLPQIVADAAGNTRDRVLSLTKYERPEGPVRAETYGTIEREGYKIERLLYWTAPGRYVPALLFAPTSPNSRAVIYVDSRGKAAEAGISLDLDTLANLGYTVLALDTEGTGETASDWGGYSSEWFGQEKIAWLGLMVGRPLMGLRMEDISRGLDLLEQRQLAKAATGFAKGMAAVDMLHAAVVDARIERLVLERMPASYRQFVQAPLHRNIHSIALSKVLRAYDLPNLATERNVAIVNPVDAMGHPLNQAAARQLYGEQLRLRRETDPISIFHSDF